MFRQFASPTAGVVIAGSLVLLLGCGGQEKMMTRDEIDRETVAIPTLYISESGKEVVAPGNRRRVTIDPKSGELAFAAYTCTNPQCPGEGKDGRPYVFAWPDPFAYVDNGEVKYKPVMTKEDQAKQDAFGNVLCPACAQARNGKLSEDEFDKLRGYVTYYTLPEAKKRLEELNEASMKLIERQKDIENKRQAK